MKSKKFIALALSASIAFSAAYVSMSAVSNDVPSVSAAKATVKAEADLWEKKVTITFAENAGSLDWNGGGYYEYYWELNQKLYDVRGSVGCDSMYTFVGWSLKETTKDTAYGTFFSKEDAENAGYNILPKDVTLGMIVEKTYRGSSSFNLDAASSSTNGTAIGKSSVNKGDTIVVYPVFRRWESEDEYNGVKDAAAEAAAAQSEIDKRNGHLDGSIWTNYSGNNVTYYWYDKDVRYEGVTTAWPRTVLISGEKGQYTTANYDKNKDGDSSEWVSAAKYKGVLTAAKITDPEKEIFFVYDVHFATNEGIIGLISGKKAQVRLKIPSSYDLGNYDPYVYHIVYGGNGMKRVKVQNLDVGKNDVTFYANDFSPYVLLLLPKGRMSTGSEYDNPPTADASAIPVMLLAAASLSAAGSLLMRRKRELGE